MHRIGWLIMVVVGVWFIQTENPLISWRGFVDPPSLLWCVGMVFGQMLILRGMCGSDAPSKKRIEWHESWQMAATSSWSFGTIGTVGGFILMLGDMRPETMGSGIAISLLSLLYGGLLAECVCRPLAVRARRRIASEQK